MFKAFCTRKERKLRGVDKIFIFVFISVTKTLLVPYLVLSALVGGEQIATCFSVKKNAWVTIRRMG